jgi:methylase of polypeptide subunit release factors
MTEQTIELENGLIVYLSRGLDGGGSTHRQDFIKALGKNEKKYFNRIFEWCSGPGFIGYNLLDQKMCEHVVFSDIHQPAINFVNKTAERNNVKDNVTSYVMGEIKNIPITEKWDLVLGNPPHCFDIQGADFSYIPPTDSLEDWGIDDLRRLIEDREYKIHIEFFENIIKYLEPNADIYLSEIGEDPFIKELAINNGLTFIEFSPAPELSRTSSEFAGIFHFKYIRNT